ncbi:L,D-transpeptidase [Tsukamurella soli]|uniref:L,D-transpeptidase n=1 Tax=Tsukamurella soli TaxID=644556 RepID=UPI0036190FC9
MWPSPSSAACSCCPAAPGAGGGAASPSPRPAALITVDHAATTLHNPATPIVVQADGEPLSKVVVTSVRTGKVVAGTFGPKNATWTSTSPLEFGARYTVAAESAGAGFLSASKSAVVATIPTDKTAYANVVPDPGLVASTGIGVGQPMVFQFTKPVVNKAAVQKLLVITTDPPQPGAWYWTDDQDVHYRAATYWRPGTRIHIEAHVFGVDLGNGIYGAENNTADYTVHDSWIAKADGATETLTVFHNGAQVNSMPMSLGDPGHPSHNGPHVVSAKTPSIVMDSCTYGVCQGDPGYYSETVYLDLRISNDGEFVHSAPWSVGQQGNSNVSHGCVNLSPANAQWMYDHFNIGDVVEVTNSGGPPLPVWDTYGDWEVPWSTWQAGNATN